MIYFRAIFMLIVLFSVSNLSGAQEWQNFDSLFEILKEKKITLSRSPTSSLIIVIGLPPGEHKTSEFRKAVENGSTLVIASEKQEASSFFRTFGFDLKKKFVFNSPFSCFKNQPDCPVISDFNSPDKTNIFNGVSSLVTNRAKIIGGDNKTLASYPALFGKGPDFAKITRLSRGAVIAVGDQSLFINLMLPEGDNKRFLSNILDMSRNSDISLFIHGRLIQNEKEQTQAQPPLPDFLKILPDISPEVDDFNYLIANIQKEFPFQQTGRMIFPFFLLLATAVIILLFTRQILKIYLPSKNPFPKDKKQRIKKQKKTKVNFHDN